MTPAQDVSQRFPTPGPRKTMAVAVSAALAGGSQAIAQDPMLEEVIVTATKRSSNMQDIPQSIQAFTTEDIQRRGFRGIDDYSKQVPGLAMVRREPAGTSVVFRGVASSGIQFGTNPSAAVYLDEQPVTSAGRNLDPRLIDIARVEALSGPQGTLFGDSSQSGTLRVITNKADTTGFEAWIEGGQREAYWLAQRDSWVAGLLGQGLIIFQPPLAGATSFYLPMGSHA